VLALAENLVTGTWWSRPLEPALAAALPLRSRAAPV